MLLGLALLVNAILLWPEIRIERVPVNDLSFHIAASQRLTKSVITGDSFLDPWMSQWALGYPLWHFYQPLPHMVAGLWLGITSHFASAPASFAVLYYLLMVALPARPSPIAAPMAPPPSRRPPPMNAPAASIAFSMSVAATGPHFRLCMNAT